MSDPRTVGMYRGAAVLFAFALGGVACAGEILPARGSVEIEFTPGGRPEATLIALIDGARRSVRVQAYAFTSRPIAAALIAARRRGVSVEVLADARMNRRARGNVVPDLLAGGIPVAFETRYAAAHNKVLIADADGPGCALATGSYNFTQAAKTRNAENLLVVRDHCALAQRYLDNWQRHRDEATPIHSLPWTKTP